MSEQEEKEPIYFHIPPPVAAVRTALPSEYAGREVFLHTESGWFHFKFYTLYQREESGQPWITYIPLPADKEGLKQWIKDLLEQEKIEL